MAMATQLGASPIAGYYLGYFLDQYFGTTWLKPVCAIVALLGSLGGLIKDILRDQKIEQRAEREDKQK
jgi:F0F1-type ATP synthase assembly protein I